MDYEELARDILSRFKKAGADAEVFVQVGDNLEIAVREGNLENLKQSGFKGVGVRVLFRKRMSFVDSTDFSKGSIDSLVDKGLSLAKIASEDEYNVLPMPEKPEAQPRIYDSEVKRISIEEKTELAKRIEGKALSYDPLITKSEGCSYEDSDQRVVVANTLGVFQSYFATYCHVELGVVAEKGESRQPGEYETGSRFFSDLMSIEDIADNAGRRAVAMVGGEPVKTQRAAVIFDRLTGERLLGGIADALNGEQVALERSFLRGKVGERIGSPLVTLIDDGIMDKGNGSRPVDGEGVPTQKRTLVEQGILKGYFYNARAASRTKGRSTGNGSRRGYGSVPGIGHHNFYMVPGRLSPDDIVKGTSRGLYVLQAIGFGVDAESGGFSVGASGVWIENGRPAGPVAKVTAASRMPQMLQGIDAIGNDLIMDRSTVCPTFRIKEMTIGGV
ncbi:MAG: TldD/PmbA family protein [bacterium]